MTDPFEGYTVSKPLFHKRIGRWHVNIRSKDHHTSMTYARYLMCMHEGRWLGPDEHVDHIDDNKLNDVIENLQILTKSENSKKNSPGRTMVTLVCPACNEEFTKERRQTHIVKGGKPTVCSRKCIHVRLAAEKQAQYKV